MLKVRIITPLGIYKECNASIINIVTTDGQRGVMPNHMPLVTMLEISIMSIQEEQTRETYTIGGGMFYLDDNNNVTILVDSIENIKDIDMQRAQRAKERAEQALKDQSDRAEMLKSDIALKRAVNRLGAGQYLK